jgi:cell division protein FtsI/penicillin-binding protein 2
VLALVLAPGARSVDIVADALDIGPLALRGDQQYRHLRVVDGKLDWHTVAGTTRMAAGATAAGVSEVTLHDRNGTLLWSDGAPTAQAEAAGLAPLLGIRREHASSIAGMLGRLPLSHSATLSIDLPVQLASVQALECVGMRRGHWNGKQCSGGSAAIPAGRHAGLVVLDLDNGDVLAEAGAGAGLANTANWNEVRDFDQSNPARSPLRLPALQHDGGGRNSPGSTFKIISALGMELAAQHDPQLNALLAGMPLPAINQLAKQRGFAFQTNAPAYPFDARHVRITNYREQALDRRAEDGKLGLAQALTYSLNTWFAWSGELSDRSLFGRAEGGVPGVQALEPGALDTVRPIAAMARRLGFEQSIRLDGGLLPAQFAWGQWDALQASASHIDPVTTRHELRQMAIGLRMQATPLQMALAAGAVGQGKLVAPRLLLELDGRRSVVPSMPALGVRLDRIRAGMKGVVDVGTGAAAFRGMEQLRRGLSGKTGTSPSVQDLATVWFTGYLEPGSLPNQPHRLAIAAFVSHSEASGGEHAAPIVASLLANLASQKPEQKGK